MSGVEVIGAISAVISIVDACIKIYNGAAKDIKLSETFHEVARKLPILVDTLNTCKKHLDSRKGSISTDVWQALGQTLESCEDKARSLRTIFEKVITSEIDGWHDRYIKTVRKLGKGNKVEELMVEIIKDVQIVVNHHVVQPAQQEQCQQLEQIIEEIQKSGKSMEDDEGKAINITNSYGKQNVNLGDGPQFNNETMNVQNLNNIVPRQKVDFSFKRPIGLCLHRAPCVDPSLIVGRDAQIDQIHQTLRPEEESKGQRRVVLGGMGGIGKTQLAISYAMAKIGDYDTIFWIDATSEATLKASLKSMTEYIFNIEDLQHLTSQQAIAGLRQWLLDFRNTRWLLIFDNYDEPESYNLEDYYPQTSHGAIIVTTRLPDRVDAQALKIPPLDDIEQCLEILQRRSKRMNIRTDIHARYLAERLAGLPLALVTAGAFLHVKKCSWSFEEYLNEYDKHWHLDSQRPLRLQEYRNRTLYNTWDISYRHLLREDPVAAQILKLLAYFGNERISYKLFRSGRHDELPGWLLQTIEESSAYTSVMRILVEYCFIELHPYNQDYGMHTCIHEWALASLNTRIESWSYWYAFGCVTKTILSINFHDRGFSQHVQHVSHAVRLTHNRFHVVAQHMKEHEVEKSLHVAMFLQRHFQLAAAENMVLRLLSWLENAMTSDHELTLLVSSFLATLYSDQGKLDEAAIVHNRVVAKLERLTAADDWIIKFAVHGLAAVSAARGNWSEAEVLCQRALAINTEISNSDDELTLQIVNSLGVTYMEQGLYIDAENTFLRLLAGVERMFGPHHAETLRALHNLGTLYQKQGMLDKAEMFLKRILIEEEAILPQDHPATLLTMNNLGTLYRDQGDLHKAETMYEQALAGYQRSQRRHDAYMWLLCDNLGLLYRDVGKLEKAVVLFSSAVTGLEETLGPNHIWTLTACLHLCYLYEDCNELDEAEKMCLHVLAGFKKTLGGGHRKTRRIANNLAILCLKQGKYKLAISYARQGRSALSREFIEQAQQNILSCLDLAPLDGETIWHVTCFLVFQTIIPILAANSIVVTLRILKRRLSSYLYAKYVNVIRN